MLNEERLITQGNIYWSMRKWRTTRYSWTVIIDRQTENNIRLRNICMNIIIWLYKKIMKIYGELSMNKRADKPRCSFKAFKLIEMKTFIGIMLNLQKANIWEMSWRKIDKSNLLWNYNRRSYGFWIKKDSQEMKCYENINSPRRNMLNIITIEAKINTNEEEQYERTAQ